jgi:hypothetical protein
MEICSHMAARKEIKMAVPNDKRIHWFMGTNKLGQEMRMCNGHVSGRFVPSNKPEHVHDVTCSLCVKILKDEDKLAKAGHQYSEYRALWG